jgi:hypothetical protein
MRTLHKADQGHRLGHATKVTLSDRDAKASRSAPAPRRAGASPPLGRTLTSGEAG